MPYSHYNLAFFGRWLLAILCGMLVSCQHSGIQQRQQATQQWFQVNGKVKVLATTAMVADLIKGIGAEHVDTLTLITGELDPHTYQLVKGDDEKFAFAHLIFSNGLGLEHGASLLTQLEHSPQAHPLGNYIIQNHAEQILLVDGRPDPHIWMDLALWSKAIPMVVEALSHTDPVHAEDYRQHGEELEKALLHTHEQVRAMLSSVPSPQRYLVTSHDAFNYFTRAYLAEEAEKGPPALWQERFCAPEGLAPESQISSEEIRSVIEYIKRHQVHIIFSESNVSKDSLYKVLDTAKQLGLEVVLAPKPLYGDAMGPPESAASTHLGMLEYNAKTIADCMVQK